MRLNLIPKRILCIATGVLVLAKPCVASKRSSCRGVKPIKTDVVVIGAGAAGVRAAARVLEVDPSLDVTILESTNRIGGRVESKHNFGDAGVTIQKGANWIYDDGNDIFELAVNSSIPFSEQDFYDIQAYEYDTNAECASSSGDHRSRKASRKLQNKQPEALGRLLRTLEDDDSVDASMKRLMQRFLRRELGRHDKHHHDHRSKGGDEKSGKKGGKKSSRKENKSNGKKSGKKDGKKGSEKGGRSRRSNSEKGGRTSSSEKSSSSSEKNSSSSEKSSSSSSSEKSSSSSSSSSEKSSSNGSSDKTEKKDCTKVDSIDSDEVLAAIEVFAKGAHNCTGDKSVALWCEEVDEMGNPLVIDHGMLAEFIACGWDSTDPLAYLAKFYDADFANTYDDSSLYAWSDVFDVDAPYFVTGDLETSLQQYAEVNGVEPVFNSRVSKVKYNVQDGDTRARVFTTLENNDSSDSSDDESCVVYDAQRVISTVSVGVLNNELIEFEPQLTYSPSEFNPMKMGQFVKIFYEFPEAFWDNNEIIFTLKSDDNDGVSLVWLNLNHEKYFPGSNILLLALVTDPFEKVVGSKNIRKPKIPKRKLKELLKPLEAAYMESYKKPIDMYHTDYHSSLDTGFGAYSNWETGYSPWDYYKFFGGGNETSYYLDGPCAHNGCNGDPLDESTEWILYLSGAASCLSYWELIHGGWYAGEIAANNALQSMGKTEEEMGYWYDMCYSGL